MSDAPSSCRRRILAVDLPLFPVERLRRQWRSAGVTPPDAPLALTERCRGRLVLTALDARAQALGLAPGLPLGDARLRVPDLAAWPADPHADAACLEWLADSCERYTPMVAVAPPCSLLLDITGSAHLWGGEAGLAADLVARFAGSGFKVRLAIAANGETALALARYRARSATDLPVEALAIADERHLALRRAGLGTLAALAGQPRAVLAARFGEETIRALAALLDGDATPFHSRCHPAPIMVEHRLATPVTTVEAALIVMERLTLDAGMALAEREEGGRQFVFALFRSDGHVARLMVETAAPVRDAKILIRLLRERIGSLADPLDPGFGYDLLRLSVPVAEPLAPQQLGLEGGTLAEAEIVALIDRLVARLGPGRVRRLAGTESHVPEQAAFDLPLTAAPPMQWSSRRHDEAVWRPLQLFDPPQAIKVIAEVPDGPPRRFEWRRQSYEIVRHEGPERIAAQWWRRADGRGLTRDYYRLEDGRGLRFWVFRHGLYGDEQASPAWYLHGRFA